MSRPTPQTAPQFEDRLPEQYSRPGINQYLTLHRTYGPPLYPASDLPAYKGRWSELFGREAPLHLEIGAGNGAYLAGLAQQHPEWNIIGIEIRYKRTVWCAKKIRAAGLSNAIIGRYHAAYLNDLFTPGSLSGVHVNHPDPWPKDKHEKNRLISRWFLEDLCSLLIPGGRFRLKSDYEPNCERVVELLDRNAEGEALPRLPLNILGRSSDVNGEGAPWENDIPTEYQQKMLILGVPVHALEAERTSDP